MAEERRTGGLTGEITAADVGEVMEKAEPWESWETQLCVWSIAIGLGALVVLGILIDLFILPD